MPAHPFRMQGYHSSTRRPPVGRAPNQPFFGLEMEISGTFSRTANALHGAGFTEADFSAENDSTVDVEWITRPLSPSELLEFVRKAVVALRQGGASNEGHSCGCHHHVDRDALTEEGWAFVARATTFHQDKLKKLHAGGSRSWSWCAFAPLADLGRRSSAAHLEWYRRNGRAALNLRGMSSPTVEFRWPSMSLDPNVMVLQSKFILNVMENARNPEADPRSLRQAWGPFTEDDEALLRDLGVDPDYVSPYDTAPPRPREGLWDIREGDTVQVIGALGSMLLHGLDPRILPTQLSRESMQSCQYRVTAVGEEACPGVPASRSLTLVTMSGGEERSAAIAHCVVIASGDDSRTTPVDFRQLRQARPSFGVSLPPTGGA